MTIYFEDLPVGRVIELGSVTVDADDVIEFATRFDPQPFHTDPAAAEASVFGGLIASGWHTCALFMRLYVDTILRDAAGQGSPGVEDIRWLAPVRPGDVLTGRATIVGAAPSASKPDRGTITSRCEMTNQGGVVVMRMTAVGLYTRREPGPAG